MSPPNAITQTASVVPDPPSVVVLYINAPFAVKEADEKVTSEKSVKAVVEDKVTAKKVEEVAEVQVAEKATPKVEKAEVKEVVENTPVEFDWDAFEAEERDTYTSEERKK